MEPSWSNKPLLNLDWKCILDAPTLQSQPPRLKPCTSPPTPNIDKIEEELVNSQFVIPGNKFVKFTHRFKYLGTYITQDLSDNTDIDERILSASKNFNALGKEIFRNRKISLHIRCRLYIATTVNILLWGCDTWALTCLRITKLEVFHCICIRKMLGITMHQQKWICNEKIKSETSRKLP